MEYSFSGYQIAELAVEIEKEGVRLYRHMAGLSDNPAVKELFLSLAQDEIAHRDAFTVIARNAKAAGQTYGYSVNIAGLIKTGIDQFKKAMANSTPMDASINMHQALVVAINNERQAVKIYTEIARNYPKEFTKVFESIIIQESAHLKKLEILKSELGL
jgi:rubrerythrin